MTLLDSLNTVFLTENIFSYLLLLVLTLLILIVGTRMKYGVLIAVPIGLLAGVYWLSNGLGWHFLILIFSSIGVLLVQVQEDDLERTITSIVFLVFGVGGYLLLFTTINGLSTGSWTFTGHDLAVSLLPFIPWLWVAGAVVKASYSLWKGQRD